MKPMQKLYPNITKQKLGFVRLLNGYLEPFRKKTQLKIAFT